MKPILLATDGSPSAEAATHEAIDLAQAFHTQLVVVSVAQPVLPVYGGYYGYGEIAAELQELETHHVSHVLAETQARAATRGVPCETVELDGPVGEAICQFALEHEPRVLVVGAHGWGRIGRLIHGSVSTYVLHHAPCPVLVVAGTEGEPDAASLTKASAHAPIAEGSKRS